MTRPDSLPECPERPACIPKLQWRHEDTRNTRHLPYRSCGGIGHLQLELQAIVSCPTCMLRTKFMSFAKAVRLCKQERNAEAFTNIGRSQTVSRWERDQPETATNTMCVAVCGDGDHPVLQQSHPRLLCGFSFHFQF